MATINATINLARDPYARLVGAGELAIRATPLPSAHWSQTHERSSIRPGAALRRPGRPRRHRRPGRGQPHPRRPGRARRLWPCDHAPSPCARSIFPVPFQVAGDHHRGRYHGIRPRFQSGRSGRPSHVYRALHSRRDLQGPSRCQRHRAQPFAHGHSVQRHHRQAAANLPHVGLPQTRRAQFRDPRLRRHDRSA